jgi:hypothetical protein
MRIGILMAVLALFFFAGQPADPAEARSRTYYSFSHSGGGVSVTVGRAPRYYAQRRYYRVPRRGYYYRSRRPRVRAYRRAVRACNYWHRRCGANWGYRGRNYRGCMRYHGC